MSGTGDRSEARIALAAVAGAHGIKGEVRLKLFTDNVNGLAMHQTVYVGGAETRLLSIREAGKGVVARIDRVADRSSAEALRGKLIEVERSSLPPLDESEYYFADLIDCPVEDQQGSPIGSVIAVENFGAGDLLEIKLMNGKTSLIPFRPGVADLADGRIVCDPIFLA